MKQYIHLHVLCTRTLTAGKIDLAFCSACRSNFVIKIQNYTSKACVAKQGTSICSYYSTEWKDRPCKRNGRLYLHISIYTCIHTCIFGKVWIDQNHCHIYVPVVWILSKPFVFSIIMIIAESKYWESTLPMLLLMQFSLLFMKVC